MTSATQTAVRPLKIGIDAREAFRLNPRGIGLYVRHLARELVQLRPQDELFLYHERPVPPDMPVLGPHVHPRRHELRGSRWHAWERVLMPYRLWRDDLDLYHGTYNTLPPKWPLSAPPMVVTLHDVIVTWWDEDRIDSYVRYCRQVTRRVVAQAAAILTVSEWSKADIVSRFGAEPEKIVVFHNGVHPDFLAGAPDGAGDRARQRWADGRPYVFAIGSPLERKNTGGMLDALGRLRARGELDHLVLVSGLHDHELPPMQERAHRAGLDGLVRFLPYLDRAQLIETYAGADLAIYPSRVEGWGIPVVEALSLGVPVATSRTSGMLEAGGEHAAYFDPCDGEEIAAVVRHCLDHPDEFARSRTDAIARARGFTWRRAAEITLETYCRVLQ